MVACLQGWWNSPSHPVRLTYYNDTLPFPPSSGGVSFSILQIQAGIVTCFDQHSNEVMSWVFWAQGSWCFVPSTITPLLKSDGWRGPRDPPWEWEPMCRERSSWELAPTTRVTEISVEPPASEVPGRTSGRTPLLNPARSADPLKYETNKKAVALSLGVGPYVAVYNSWMK